jgi:shikimate dehydrogenase
VNQDSDLRRLFVLLGDPVEHSSSPAIHNSAFAATKMRAVYTALRAPDEMVGPLMREIARAGGGGNVTVPHKATAGRALDLASEAVQATGACNVFWWEDGRGLCGDNTDVPGFGVAAEAVLGASLRDTRVLLLGAGGAARAVVHRCLTSGVAGLDVLSRSRMRGEGLADQFGRPPALRLIEESEASSVDRYDLVVNATSVGLQATDSLIIEPAALGATALLDLVYGPDETELVKAARGAGIRAEDGRRMLAEQAALSFELWFDMEAPRDAMYRSVGLQDS